MGEMVERVAMKILAEVPLGYGMTPAEAQKYARTAIETMREPTSEMTKAARLRWNSGHDKTAWQLMIDEALK